MSDFSELCPLFSTGMYNELTIGQLTFTALSTTNDATVGKYTLAAHPGSLKFGRSVIVTNVFLKKLVTATTPLIVYVGRRAATGTAALTVFASLASSTTVTVHCVNRYRKMTQAANKNFNAADVLGITCNHASAAAMGKYEFIVRFKDR